MPEPLSKAEAAAAVEAAYESVVQGIAALGCPEGLARLKCSMPWMVEMQFAPVLDALAAQGSAV